MTIERREIAIRRRNFYNDGMLFPRSASLFGLLALTISLGACAGGKLANVNSANTNIAVVVSTKSEIVPQDNVEELGKIIRLPFTPEEATYSEISLNTANSEPRLPAPNEKKFVAVLKFSAADAAQIAAAAEKYKSPVPSDVDAETWFPPELVAKSQETGDEFLKGTSYAVNDFTQMPYTNGKLTRLNDTNYFVLELTAF